MTVIVRTFFNPGAVLGPLAAAHEEALAAAAETATGLAPGRIRVEARPEGPFNGRLEATGPGAIFAEEGTRPHEEAPRAGGVLAGPNFGPVGGPVHHPGEPAQHFTQHGAEAYPELFASAARASFALGI